MGEGHCVKAVVCASFWSLYRAAVSSCWLEFQEMLRDMEAHPPQEPLSVFPSTCPQVIGSTGSWEPCWDSELEALAWLSRVPQNLVGVGHCC